MARHLQSLNLSASVLRAAKMPEQFCIDYVNVHKNMQTLSTQFQMLKSGSQAIGGSFVPVTGWAVERNVGGFGVDAASGTITIPAVGDYTIDATALCNEGTGIEIKVQKNGVDIAGADAQSAQRATISNLLFDASLDNTIVLLARGTGGAITVSNARITIGRKS